MCVEAEEVAALLTRLLCHFLARGQNSFHVTFPLPASEAPKGTLGKNSLHDALGFPGLEHLFESTFPCSSLSLYEMKRQDFVCNVRGSAGLAGCLASRIP